MTSSVTRSLLRCIVFIRKYPRLSNECLACLDELRDELVELASAEREQAQIDASSSLTENDGMSSVRLLNEWIEQFEKNEEE